MNSSITRLQASESYKANLLKSKPGDQDSSGGTTPVERHTDGVTSLMVAAVGGHMVRAAASVYHVCTVPIVRASVLCRAHCDL